jgi:hypothetical protein
VRFVCVVCVPLCVRVFRVSRVCPGSPRCLFTGTGSVSVPAPPGVFVPVAFEIEEDAEAEARSLASLAVQRLDSGVNRIDGLAYWPPLGLLRRGDPPEHGWVHTPRYGAATPLNTDGYTRHTRQVPRYGMK